MIAKLKGIEERFIKVEHLLSDPAVISDQKKYQGYLKEHGELNKVVPKFREYESALEELEEAKELLKDDDPDMRAMAREEIPQLEQTIETVKTELNVLLMPKDPRDGKNVILEIRAGTGGEEAGLFAGDLFRMYSRYVEGKNWKTEVIEKNNSSSGGFKEIVFMVSGKGAFSSFKYESGTHRVQRVPETEAQGRVHGQHAHDAQPHTLVHQPVELPGVGIGPVPCQQLEPLGRRVRIRLGAILPRCRSISHHTSAQ